MRILQAIRLGWIAMVLLFTASLGATPLKEPTRLVRGQTVNLLPLFHWWTNRSEARPLPAWVHVTGSIIGTNAVGWIVQGQVERAEHSAKGTASGEKPKFILKDPPAQDRAEFERLSATLKALNQERSKLGTEETNAQNQAKVIAKEQRAYRRYRLRSPALALEGRQVQGVEGQAKAGLKQLDQQLLDLKKKLAAYPSMDHYVVDCFALQLGRELEGKPVYDYGIGFSSSSPGSVSR